MICPGNLAFLRPANSRSGSVLNMHAPAFSLSLSLSPSLPLSLPLSRRVLGRLQVSAGLCPVRVLLVRSNLDVHTLELPRKRRRQRQRRLRIPTTIG